MTPLTIDLHHDLLTIRQAAQLAGVSPSTVRMWIDRGYQNRQTHQREHLQRHGTTRACLLGIEVLQAEAATRHAAGRRPYLAIPKAHMC